MNTHFLKWVFVSRFKQNQQRSWKESIFALLVIAFCTIILSQKYLDNPVKEQGPVDLHTAGALALSINNALCHKIAYSDSLVDFLITAPLNTRISTIPTLLAGTKNTYCENVRPINAHEEYSLMYTLTAIIKINPNITLKGLGDSLVILRFICVLFFIFVLLHLGISLVLGLFLSNLAIIILYHVHLLYVYSMYSFLLPLPVVLIAFIALALDLKLHKRLVPVVCVGFLIGFGGAFIINVRTSYLPLVFCCFFLYCCFSWFDIKRDFGFSKKWKMLLPAISLCTFLLGYNVFQRSFIASLPATTEYAHTYHVVAHSLLLSLSVPENELAKREGFIWGDDYSGLIPARKIDPNINYLDKNYESALWIYYAKLWLFYPSEMLEIYINKSRALLRDFYGYKKNMEQSNLIKIVGLFCDYINDGKVYFYLFIMCVFLGLLCWSFWNIGIVFFLVAFFSIGALISLEGMIIMPYFVIGYHNLLLFIALTLVLGLFQLFFESIINRGMLWCLEKKDLTLKKPYNENCFE